MCWLPSGCGQQEAPAGDWREGGRTGSLSSTSCSRPHFPAVTAVPSSQLPLSSDKTLSSLLLKKKFFMTLIRDGEADSLRGTMAIAAETTQQGFAVAGKELGLNSEYGEEK